MITRSTRQLDNDTRRALWAARFYGAGLHRRPEITRPRAPGTPAPGTPAPGTPAPVAVGPKAVGPKAVGPKAVGPNGECGIRTDAHATLAEAIDEWQEIALDAMPRFRLRWMALGRRSRR